jgi:hypothetical protein
MGDHKLYSAKATAFIASLHENRVMNKRSLHCATAVNDDFSGVMREQVDYFSAIYEKSGDRALLVVVAYIT